MCSSGNRGTSLGNLVPATMAVSYRDRSCTVLHACYSAASQGTSMVAKPEVSITAGEPRGDAHGQFSSPATVTLAWPKAGQLPGPSIQIALVAPIRGQMTVDELRQAHMQAAHDVLNAALLSIETAPKVEQVKRRSRQRSAAFFAARQPASRVLISLFSVQFLLSRLFAATAVSTRAQNASVCAASSRLSARK